MDRKQHENLSEPGREPGDCDYLKNPVSTGLMRNEQKPLSGFVCVFVVVLLFMFLVGGFFESLLKVAVFSLQNFWVLFVFAVFFICSRILYPKKIEQNGFVDIFTGKTDNSGTIIENVESNGVHAKEGFCLLIDIFKLVCCLVVLLVIGIVVFLVKWVLDGGLFFIEILSVKANG